MSCGWIFYFDKIEINNKRSHDGNGKLRFPLLSKEIKFPWPIGSLLAIKDVYVIMLDNVSLRNQLEREKKKYNLYNENVFGVSKETGEILWQIEPISYPKEDSPYTGIWKEGDKLGIYNWTGYTLIVEPETGKVLKSEFTK